ncbi:MULTISPECIES: AraC family transcriptional regulator [Pseudomonas]|jgi:AraC-like DNA-binding protein|uniref:AraC family transcriptional regulator ligand-binding domain-containing protein n=1 Tax=Pseudomonas sp. Hg7Tf TaxID=3236988 RepID=A0AB39I636_9PSED|nr:MULTISPECIES: AraC family transcriptional regulator [Pseudomonas]KJK07761.1 AraC family transcriptional regulator [Pseudomonas sp. 5]MDD1977035.1 AraC family transcriptional regulator [Pseudomonas putida]MDH2558293.1 AraC family transcriptional regulator ligand-binding domain-containing protein [Pseudomonas sp. Hg5Tf]QYX48223.1 AraC family transcriptional regulator [Pseudomonas sp. S11A 273]
MSTLPCPPANAFYAPTLLPAIEELQARGVDLALIEAVFRRSLFELRTPFLRVPLMLSRRFWTLALAETCDPLIGLAAGRRFVSTATNGLTYLFDVAASLDSACAFFVEYFPFFNGHFRARIERNERQVTLRLEDCGSLKATAPITDYMLTSISSLLRRKLLASGLEQDPILAIELAHPAPADTTAHPQAWRTPVSWGHAEHGIHLNPQLFTQPLTPGNQALEQMLVSLLQQTQRNSQPTLLELASDHLAVHLADSERWPLFYQGQHLLERTAARRLRALGWSFSQLLDEYRRYRAEDLLHGSALELVQIADQLGYSDVQSFHRASLRWFDCAPGAYRAR